MIRQKGSKWVLLSKDGSKTLGTFGTKAQAEDRERQIQFFKHKSKESILRALELWIDKIKSPQRLARAKALRGFDPEEGLLESGKRGESMDLRVREDGAREKHYTLSDIRIIEGDTPDLTGKAWEVTIIGAKTPSDVVMFRGKEYVPSQNGRLYSCEALKDSVSQWNGVKVYDNHLSEQEFEQKQGMRSVAKEWVGTIVQPRWDENRKQLRGVLRLVDETLASKLLEAHKQKVLGTIGLSIDTYPKSRGAFHEGQPIVVIEGFEKIMSVDVVTEPAAGGGFNRLLASHIFTEQETGGNKMNFTPEFAEALEAMIESAVARALEQEEPEEELPPEEELEEQEEEDPELAAATDAVVSAVQDVAAEEPEEEMEADDMYPDEEEDPELESLFFEAEDPEAGVEDDIDPQANQVEGILLEGMADVAHRLRVMESTAILNTRLAESKLPKPLQTLVRNQFEGKAFKESDLMGAIKKTRKAFSSFDQTGRVSGLGGRGRIVVGMNERDKHEVELLRLLAGNSDFRALENNEEHFVRERFTEAFNSWVKHGRPNYGTRRLSDWTYEILGGNPLADQHAAEAITTSGMSSIVKNALNLMLAASYSKRHRWWEPLVKQEEVETIDDATLVRTYGMNTLDVVNEGGPYTELEWADDEETASFVKKGNFAGITIETMLRDHLNEVRRIPDRLSNSWYNTISNLVSGVFTTNTAAGPVLSDTGALFNATAATSTGGHANLLTAALSITAYDAAYTAMQKQTDQALGAGQRLLVEPKYLLVPTDLRANAMQIRNSELIPGSQNNDINPYYQGFEVIVVPTWTDTNNWALVADPNEWPSIWLIFLRGRTVPELFTADSEQYGAMFTNDVLRYKVRMLTWRFSSTYDCAPVADFRGLHKNNVA